MKKQILILALLLPLLAGCTAKQPEPLPCTPGEAQRLVVYTSHKEEVYTPIIREFEERTGIWVDVVSGGTNELLQRIQQEADAPKADVMFGGGVESLESYQDCFSPYICREPPVSPSSFRRSPATGRLFPPCPWCWCTIPNWWPRSP